MLGAGTSPWLPNIGLRPISFGYIACCYACSLTWPQHGQAWKHFPKEHHLPLFVSLPMLIVWLTFSTTIALLSESKMLLGKYLPERIIFGIITRVKCRYYGRRTSTVEVLLSAAASWPRKPVNEGCRNMLLAGIHSTPVMHVCSHSDSSWVVAEIHHRSETYIYMVSRVISFLCKFNWWNESADQGE